MTWSSVGQDGSGYGIYGQRFDSAGAAVGAEFQVNSTTAGTQWQSSTTALNDGGFVVTWSSIDPIIYSSFSIYGQRFDSAGVAVGAEFQVNSFTTNYQHQQSSITALNDGGFVVTWSFDGQDGSGAGIYGQRYDSAGAAVGGEFQVNSTTAGNQWQSSTTALNDGGFVVIWSSYYDDGIYGQRFDSAGATVGGRFHFNSTNASFQWESSTTALNDGGFVVTWSSDGQDGSGAGIYGQRFDSEGVAVGAEFQVNSTTYNIQSESSTTALDDGGFVVTWSSDGQDGSASGIYGQRFDSDGQKVMEEPAVIGVQSLDFNDLNLIAGDSLTLNIEGGNSLDEVLGSEGLDQALENLASSLATYSDLFSAVNAEQGVLTFQGLTDGSAVAEVSVAITPTTDLGLETLVIDSNENNDAVIDFQATGGSVTLEGVEMANLTAAHFQLHDLSSVV